MRCLRGEYRIVAVVAPGEGERPADRRAVGVRPPGGAKVTPSDKRTEESAS